MSTKVYDVINSRIMELLEQGTVPWRKTWNTASNQPRNLVSKKEYRGINTFILATSSFSSPYWMTYKQAADKGGHVIKGSKSTPVVFWTWIDRKEGDGADSEETNTKGKIPMLRLYNVFNMEQVEGIEPPPATETIHTFTPIEAAQQILSMMPYRPEIKHGGNSASYSPLLDYVKLPVPEAFESPEEYYCTLFHELGHSTGHAKRLGRKGILEPSYFGSHIYGQEEMCVEFCSSYLSGVAGIENVTIENSASYISSWMKAIKANPKMCILAAAQAQKASDYILNRKGGEDDIILNDTVA